MSVRNGFRGLYLRIKTEERKRVRQGRQNVLEGEEKDGLSVSKKF